MKIGIEVTCGAPTVAGAPAARQRLNHFHGRLARTEREGFPMRRSASVALALCSLALVATGCGGSGSPTSPGTGFSCPTPAGGTVTVCGQISDVETGDTLQAAGATGAPCDSTPSADGPCSIQIQFYDATAFAANPATATPVVPTHLYMDDLGRYRAEDLTPPAGGYLAVALDDAGGTSDRHRLTAVVTPVVAGTSQMLRAFVTRRQTDTAWTTSAGLSGSTFADRGVIAAIFRYQEIGRAGVTITRNGTTVPADDYYFVDAGQTLSTADSAGPTGASGAVLLLNSGLVQHSGTGGEPTSCQWPSRPAASIPGVVFVQLMDAQTGVGASCP